MVIANVLILKNLIIVTNHVRNILSGNSVKNVMRATSAILSMEGLARV